MRGPRPLSDKILFVFIGPEDVRELGGWPITRDYYGYLIHVLQRGGAKAIGMDILFDKPEPVYPEYDAALADFIGSAGNVCLPMAYGATSSFPQPNEKTDARFRGSAPVYPFALLRQKAAQIGFSNLGSAPVLRRVPIVATEKDSLRLSFGAALATAYLNMDNPPQLEKNVLQLSGSDGNKLDVPLTKDGQFLVNYSGGMKTIHSIGLLDLLQKSEDFQDSLNLHDKLVIVGVTLPGVSSSTETPLSNLMPASLVHVTVAENIISGNFLRPSSGPAKFVIIVLFIMIAIIIWRFSGRKWLAIIIPAIFAIYWIFSLFMFSRVNQILPLIYPTVAFLSANILFMISYTRNRRMEILHRKALLESGVQEKERELASARSELLDIQDKLAHSGARSEEVQNLAEARQQTIQRLEGELRDLKSHSEDTKAFDEADFPEIVRSAESSMGEVLEIVQRIRENDIPVLILGETGTGKEVIARTIHNTSRRRSKPFVAVNCGALAENLLESELFGHEKGSFTGAHTQRRGRFELADGGTVFLDEITETTPSFQARLLRVLQEGHFERLGGESTLQVNVRIIAASNRDLQQELDAARFRSDLYYRLNGIRISIPPLRERKPDIPLLAKHFLRKYQVEAVDQISEQAMDALKNYSWPGNVRELENSIRRAVAMAQGEQRKMIRLNDLPPEISKYQPVPDAGDVYSPLERQILEMLQSLQFSHSSITATAKALGNRDRGTITEYFRGICFETLVENSFDVEKSARVLAASNDAKVIERVQRKINAYLKSLNSFSDEEIENSLNGKIQSLRQARNLPQKYHQALVEIIQHLANRNSNTNNPDSIS